MYVCIWIYIKGGAYSVPYSFLLFWIEVQIYLKKDFQSNSEPSFSRQLSFMFNCAKFFFYLVVAGTFENRDTTLTIALHFDLLIYTHIQALLRNKNLLKLYTNLISQLLCIVGKQLASHLTGENR